MELEQLEFCKFGIAISVGGKNIMSASCKEYTILKKGMEFCITSKRDAKARTFVALTNVPEWRLLDDGEPATVVQAKPKSSKANS